MGRIGCPETSLVSYQFTLRNISEERRTQGVLYFQNVREFHGTRVTVTLTVISFLSVRKVMSFPVAIFINDKSILFRTAVPELKCARYSDFHEIRVCSTTLCGDLHRISLKCSTTLFGDLHRISLKSVKTCGKHK